MRSEQTYIPYDFRRLVVYAPEIKQGTGIWQPVVGHDGLFPMGRVEKQEARPVSYGELNLPTQIAERFEIWAKRSIDAPLHGSINLFDRQSHYKEGALLAEDLAIFLGDRCQVDFDGNRVLVGFDRSKISNEFLYGNQYASVRNTWDFTFPSYRTYLARLLWRGISPKERGRLFPGKFDLGNRQHVQLEDCKNSSLVFELGIEEDFVEIDVNGHPFKSIEDGVKSTLGRSLESYKAQDASSAYKVVKLLFRMQKLRHKRLFKFLEMPKPRRFSLEMRELLPFRKEDVSTEDVVWLLADLKTYLGLDLPEHKFAAIQASYWPLRAVVLKIRVGVDQVLTESFGADYKLRADAYGSLTEITNSFDSSFGSIDLPLDEDLCGYVQSLEFLHYAVGMPELLSKSIPSKRSVVPVSREIGELTECVVTKWNVETHPKAPTNIFSLNELPAFFEEFDLKIWEVVVKASSKSFEASELTNEIVQDTYLILHNYFWLLREAHWAEVDVDKRQISPWLVIGALLCALDAKKHTPVAHAPYWHLMPEKQGVNTPRPTRSLRTALKDTVHLQRMADRMTLEHRLMWRNKLEWFCGSLYGMQELVIPSLRFYAAVLMKLMEITRRIRDADLNKGAQAEFMDYIYHNTLALHKRRMEQ